MIPFRMTPIRMILNRMSFRSIHQNEYGQNDV
jgi:hypothetical protein